jgi:hypothetical protein
MPADGEHQANPYSAPRSSSNERKVHPVAQLALWLGIIAIFVVFYQYFDGAPHREAPSQGTRPRISPEAWLLISTVLLAVVIAARVLQEKRRRARELKGLALGRLDLLLSNPRKWKMPWTGRPGLLMVSDVIAYLTHERFDDARQVVAAGATEGELEPLREVAKIWIDVLGTDPGRGVNRAYGIRDATPTDMKPNDRRWLHFYLQVAIAVGEGRMGRLSEAGRGTLEALSRGPTPSLLRSVAAWVLAGEADRKGDPVAGSLRELIRLSTPGATLLLRHPATAAA